MVIVVIAKEIVCTNMYLILCILCVFFLSEMKDLLFVTIRSTGLQFGS